MKILKLEDLMSSIFLFIEELSSRSVCVMKDIPLRTVPNPGYTASPQAFSARSFLDSTGQPIKRERQRTRLQDT